MKDERMTKTGVCVFVLLVAAVAGAVDRPTPEKQQTQGGFTCAGKRTCPQMTSCEEAKFYLTHCGVARLDGDKDGVPCESLCR
jgi:hypothetical protein